MAMPLNLTIYGATQDYLTTETPLVSDIAGLTGLSSVSVECYDLGAGLELNSEETEYADGRVYVDNSITGIYKVLIKYRRYPSTAGTWASYLPELAVIKKPYLWIYCSNYNIGFSVSNTTRAVNLTGINMNQFHDLMSLELTFKHRKAE